VRDTPITRGADPRAQPRSAVALGFNRWPHRSDHSFGLLFLRMALAPVENFG
jgi:hypothetical protein